MRKWLILLALSSCYGVSFGQHDLERDFNYDANDYLLFSDHYWTQGWASVIETNYGKRTALLITSKTSCGQCLHYTVKGVVDEYTYTYNQDTHASSTTHRYHPFEDTLNFCLNNPSYLDFFQEYKKKLLLSTPRAATSAEIAFMNSTFPPQGNSTPTDISLTTTTVYEGLPPGVLVATLSIPSPGPYTPSYTLETTCEGGGDDNHFFDIRDNKLYIRETFDFDSHQTLNIRVKADSRVGGFKRKDFTLTVLSDGGNHAPTDILVFPDSIPYDLQSNNLVSIIRAVDEDASTEFSYQLVSGAGDTDNGEFYIKDSLLMKLNDYTTYYEDLLRDTLKFRLRVFDGVNGYFDKQIKMKLIRGTTCEKPIIKSNGCLYADANNQIQWYEWSRDGEVINSWFYYNQVPKIIPDRIGYYTLKLHYKNGCIKSSDPFYVQAPTSSCVSSGGEPNCSNMYVMISQRGFNSLELNAYTPGNAVIHWRRDTISLSTVSRQIIAVESGTYEATAEFASGCIKKTSFIVNENYGCYVPFVQSNGITLRSTFGASYTWYLNDTKIEESSRDLLVDTPGIYTVEVEYSSGCRVKSLPVTIYQTANDCLTPTLKVENQMIISSPAASYEWFKNGAPLGIVSQQISVNELGNYTVKVTYENQCSKTSLPLNVELCTLSPKPFIAPQWSGQIAGIPYSLDNSYAWYLNGKLLPYTGGEISVEHAGDYTITIKYPNGCSKSSEPYRCHQAVSGTDCLKPEIVLSGRSLKMVVNGPGGVSLNWVRDGQYLNQWEGTLLADKPGYYAVEAYYTNGCTQRSDSITIYFLGSECIPPTIRFDGSLLWASTEQNNIWLVDGDTLETTLPWMEPSVPGEYQLIATYPNGCTKTSAPFIVTACDLFPGPQITRSGVTLTATEAESYDWFYEGQSLNSHTQSISVHRNGNYTVVATFANSCIKSSQLFEVSDIATGIASSDFTHGFKTFPNPSAGTSKLFADADVGLVKVVVLNNTGQIIQSTEWNTSEDYILSLNLQNEAPNPYLIYIYNEKKRWLIRVLKE